MAQEPTDASPPRPLRQKSHGSSRNYKFGQKNNWRRTLWNEVLRRTAGRERTESILYLAGPQDLDRPVAVSKGVPGRNLIAIDLSLGNVLNVRSSSHYAIRADALEVLRAWPTSAPVCAIVLDFCSWLMSGERLGQLSNVSMLNRALADAVLAVNFMRGRDHVANELTQQGQVFIEWLRGNPKSFAHSIDPKHRGFAFALWHVLMGCIDQPAVLERGDMTEVLQNLQTVNPKFLSYRSGTLVFDSVVMSPVSHTFTCDETVILSRCLNEKYPKDHHVVRKIAATLATRTRQCVET